MIFVNVSTKINSKSSKTKTVVTTIGFFFLFVICLSNNIFIGDITYYVNAVAEKGRCVCVHDITDVLTA